MKLRKDDQETIICFNEGEQKAAVYTHNARMRECLAALAEKYPEDCAFEYKDGWGAVAYWVSKDLIMICAPHGDPEATSAEDIQKRQG